MSAQTVWFSPVSVLSGDPSLVITSPSVAGPHTVVMARESGDLKWVYLPLPLPVGSAVRKIHLSYSIQNTRRPPESIISQIRLLEVATDGTAVVRHDDPTDLTGTAAYSSSVAGELVVSGGLSVALRLNFLNNGDAIALRTLGVEYAIPRGMTSPHAPHDYVHVSEYGAVGDGVTDDSDAIQAAVKSAVASGVRVVFDAKTYMIASPIVLSTFVSLCGTPRAADKWTILRAKNPMRSVVDLRGGLTYTIADIHVDGNRLAKYAIYL